MCTKENPNKEIKMVVTDNFYDGMITAIGILSIKNKELYNMSDGMNKLLRELLHFYSVQIEKGEKGIFLELYRNKKGV